MLFRKGDLRMLEVMGISSIFLGLHLTRRGLGELWQKEHM